MASNSPIMKHVRRPLFVFLAAVRLSRLVKNALVIRSLYARFALGNRIAACIISLVYGCLVYVAGRRISSLLDILTFLGKMPALETVSDSTDWLPTPLAALAPLESALRCQVCKDFFNTPMITSCSHTFCSLCIRRYLSQEGRCPACRSSDQELKLRRNWVVEELVAGFTTNREGLLAFATKAAEKARNLTAQDGDDSPRPKKRRKMQQPQRHDGLETERRSTRSQSRRDALQASQESTAERTIADSEAGSEYEDEEDPAFERPATKPPAAEPGDGLVACPGCGERMKEQMVFTHLDHCASINGVSDPPPARTNGVHAAPPSSQQHRTSMAYTPPTPSGAKPRDRLPTLAYSMLNDSALRKKLKDLGISSQGPKLLLQKRHTEWVNLWNANCDSRTPKTKRELLNELDVWERTQGRQILQSMNNSTNGGGQGTGVMAKDFNSEEWMRGNKSDFKELVRKAREKKNVAPSKAAATPAAPAGTAPEGQQTELEARPKTSVEEIFMSAGSGGSHGQVGAEAGTEAEAAHLRAPIREISATAKPQAEASDEKERDKSPPPPNAAMGDLTSPAKPPPDQQQQHSQGTHVFA